MDFDFDDVDAFLSTIGDEYGYDFFIEGDVLHFPEEIPVIDYE